jgi:hypothetical protein
VRATAVLGSILVIGFLLFTMAVVRPSAADTTYTSTTTTDSDVCVFVTYDNEIDIYCTIQEGTTFTLPVNLPDDFLASPVITLCEQLTGPCPSTYTDASQISDVLETVQTGPSMQLTFLSDTDSESGSTWVSETGPTLPVADINALNLISIPEGSSGQGTYYAPCQYNDAEIKFCLALTLVSDPVESTTTVPEFPIVGSSVALLAVALVALMYLRRQSLPKLN